MTMWLTVLGGSLGCYLLKYVGAAIPESFLENPFVKRVVMLLPISLLSALVAVQTFAHGQTLMLDARVPAVAAATVALWQKRSFITVVLTAAIVAGTVRYFGLAQ